MSELTDNSAHGINCELVEQRGKNFEYLNMELHNINGLEVKSGYGSFLYLLFIRNDAMERKVLQKEEVYILTLWPDVLEKRSADSLEFRYIVTILLILVDQRYEISDMKYWVEGIKMLHQRVVLNGISYIVENGKV